MEEKSDLTLKELTEIVLRQAKEKGFGTKPDEINVPEKIALIHSEISEAYEAYRHKNMDDKHGFKEELGDAMQRILHICGIFDIDIEKEVLKKIDNNKTREWNWEKMNEKPVIAKIDNETVSKIFDFLNIVNGLKKAKRYEGYDIDADSSADHTWRLSLMIFMIADELKLDIDVLKAIKISLVHDLPEALTGDVCYIKVYTGEVKKEDKNKMEHEAMLKIVSTLPEPLGKEIFDLWDEYENSRSKEAIFIKALDKIETIIHVIDKTRNHSMFDMIATYPDKHVEKIPELMPFLIELKRRLKIEYEKNNIPWKEEYDNYLKKDELIEEIDWDGNVIGVKTKKQLKENVFPHKVSVIIPKGKDGKVVLCRRSKEQHPFPDTWCCAVGGKVMAGESEHDAAIREMKEEIGTVFDVHYVTRAKYDGEKEKGLFYVFTTEKPVDHDSFCPDPAEIQYTKEFTVDEVLDMIEKNSEDFAPTFVVLFKEFAKHYK